MRITPAHKIFSCLMLSGLLLTACNDGNDREEIEENNEARVGEVYNDEVQGIDMETHDNQFYTSRMKKGNNVKQQINKVSDTLATDTIATNSNRRNMQQATPEQNNELQQQEN